MDKVKCVLNVGHTAQYPGARSNLSNDAVTEYGFNSMLAADIQNYFSEYKGVEIEIVNQAVGFGKYKELFGKINEAKPDFVISLHCNAFDTTATGTEVLYFELRDDSMGMAESLQSHLVAALRLVDRGVKSRGKGERGSKLLSSVEAPIVLAEPFFIDNPSDLKRAQEVILCKVYAEAIIEIADWLRSIKEV
jgi:N-acetylmuramoyl-L-alanine amidase